MMRYAPIASLPMAGFSTSALLAALLGTVLLPLVFIPYIAWSFRHGRTGVGHASIAAAAVLHAIALWTYTIAPFPSSRDLSCDVGTQFVPFASVGVIDWSRGPVGVLSDRMLHQVLFNILLFVPLGAMVRYLLGLRARTVVLIGFAISLLIELTQLTGIWGIYPCPYRIFDVDDLIANTLGTAIGVGVAPGLRRVPGQHERPVRRPAPVTPVRRLAGMTVDLLTVAVPTVAATLGVRAVLYSMDHDYETYTTEIVFGALVITGTLVSLVVPQRTGRTFGQRLVFLRPVRPNGSPPGTLQWLVRAATGMGPFVVLLGIGTAGRSAVGLIAWAWVAACALVVALIDPRGISGFASGLVMIDSRSNSPWDPDAPSRVDPRRMSSALLAMGGVAFIGTTVIVAIATASPTVGSGVITVAVIGLVVLNISLFLHLLINGVVILRREGVGVGNLLALATAFAPIAVTGFFGAALATEHAVLITIAVAVLTVSATLAVLFIAFLVFGQLYAHRRPPRRATAVVVLGSRIFDDRVPPLLAARIDRGIEVLEGLEEPVAAARPVDHPADTASTAGRIRRPLLVLSGGKGDDETISEAEAMARYAITAGVAPEIVREERSSRNTEENLRFSTTLLKAENVSGPVVVTTNDYHAFRTAIIAHDLGIDAQVIGAHTARYFFPSAVIREFIAMLAHSPARYGTLLVAVGTVAGWLGWIITS